MECKEALQLLAAYNTATLALSVSVQHLLNGGGIVPRPIYDEHRRAADKARIEFESARLAYETHVRVHHCGGGGSGTNVEVMLDSV